MKSAGLSLDSLSHWALVTVDRGEGTCYLYDLMSDQMLPTTKIMKNYRMHYIIHSVSLEAFPNRSALP
jgi:hypothetical protein